MIALARPFIAVAVLIAAVWVLFLWSLRRHGRDTWAVAFTMLAGTIYCLFAIGA